MNQIVLALTLLVLCACSRSGEHDPHQSIAKSRPTKPPTVRVRPSSAAEIIGEYQGLVQNADGSTHLVVLNIRRADPSGSGFTIGYTINSPGHRHDDTTTIDASGNLTVEKVASHFARGTDGRLMIESSTLAGPPFWQLIQTRGHQ